MGDETFSTVIIAKSTFNIQETFGVALMSTSTMKFIGTTEEAENVAAVIVFSSIGFESILGGWNFIQNQYLPLTPKMMVYGR
jgi:hypothetical protein